MCGHWHRDDHHLCTCSVLQTYLPQLFSVYETPSLLISHIMGNSATKEQRPLSQSRPSSSRRRTTSMLTAQLAASSSHDPTERPSAHVIYSSRNGRGSRPDLSLLGFGSGSDRDITGLESRRETKQERDARKAERERVAREHERERSMREESVDGGNLVTQGVYTGIEDYNKAVVRQLMVVLL